MCHILLQGILKRWAVIGQNLRYDLDMQAAEEVFRKEEADKRKELAERFQTLVSDFTKRMEAHMESSKALTDENHA